MFCVEIMGGAAAKQKKNGSQQARRQRAIYVNIFLLYVELYIELFYFYSTGARHHVFHEVRLSSRGHPVVEILSNLESLGISR